MPNIVETLSKVAKQAIEESMPCGVYFGTVLDNSPLRIQIDPKKTFDEDFLVLPDSLTPLAQGDKVILIRVQGGQQFVVMDKVKE